MGHPQERRQHVKPAVYTNWPEPPWRLNLKRWPEKYFKAWARRVKFYREAKEPKSKGWAEFVAYLDLVEWLHNQGECETCGDCRAIQHAHSIYPQRSILREELAAKRRARLKTEAEEQLAMYEPIETGVTDVNVLVEETNV